VGVVSYQISALLKTSRPWWKLLRPGDKMVSGIPKLPFATPIPPILGGFFKLIKVETISGN